MGRGRVMRQHLVVGKSLAQLAADHGISERTARQRPAPIRSDAQRHWRIDAVLAAEAKGDKCLRGLSDNGSTYKPHGWRNACHAIGLNVEKTRSYNPRPNGKAEQYGLRPTSSASEPHGGVDLRDAPQLLCGSQ